MTNYSEQFPACATCPRLLAWQQSVDAMNSDLDQAGMSECLAGVEKDFVLERERSKLDITYAEFMDRATEGSIPTERFATAQAAYAEVDSAFVQRMEKKEESARVNEFMSGFLNSLANGEVALLAGDCKGALAIRFFGRSAILCRSRMKRLGVNPPPPRGTTAV